MEMLLYLVPVFGILGLLFAAYLAARVGRQDAGNDRMKEIATAISDGAQAFLTAEYKILVIFVAVLFVLIGFGIGNWITAVCFVVGALFSTLAGFCGMKVATKANVRTANAAKEKGMNKALSIAFSGGAVMGMCVAGFGVFGVSIIYILTKNVDIITGFSLGASSIALFARVGGGIYTKAADVGADLVGKVEAGIPEDDPRNPAVIADNVWDNVGDVAGMGADLFESYVGALVSALTLGIVYYKAEGAIFPLLIAGLGLVASILGTFFVKGDENSNPHKALKTGSYVASVLVLIVSCVFSKIFFGDFKAATSDRYHHRSIYIRRLQISERNCRTVRDWICNNHHQWSCSRYEVYSNPDPSDLCWYLCCIPDMRTLRYCTCCCRNAFYYRYYSSCRCLWTNCGQCRGYCRDV